MLVWGGGYAICASLTELINKGSVSHDVATTAVGLVIFAVLAVRYVDALSAVVAAVFLLLFVFAVLTAIGGPWVVWTMCLVLIATMGMLYYVARRGMKSRRMVLYRNCWLWVSYVALVCFYGAGNYYVADYLYQMMTSTPELVMPRQMPFGWFFWGWTFLIPVVYMALGIRKRDITLIRIGLPLLVLGILTFRNYHHIMEPEIALLLGGTILFIVSYSLISYLRLPRAGFIPLPNIT